MPKLRDTIGFEIIRTRRHPSLSAHLDRVVRDYGINLVIDVGANYGQFAQKLRKSGYRGSIHSFEPVGECFARLEELARKDPDWHIYRLGVGSEKSTMEIHVSDGTDFSSLLNHNEFGQGRFKRISVKSTETIEIDTLDSILDDVLSQGDLRVLLKTDTQGFDLHVFEGIQRHRHLLNAIMCEVSFIPIYEGMPSFDRSINTFVDAGFSVSGLYPVTRNKDFSLIEMDCVLVNRRKHVTNAQ